MLLFVMLVMRNLKIYPVKSRSICV